ncbi:MAG TPA: hypothetical protein VLH08_09960, partial [Acidobacteriota bacterium]|nr:hypothetical protein [Acidobacteriota bacterium]
LDQLKEDILEVAQENDLPIELEDIDAQKVHIEDYDNLRVKINYVVPVTTPFYVYNWQQNLDYDAPVFE